jgi:hypothetical protein
VPEAARLERSKVADQSGDDVSEPAYKSARLISWMPHSRFKPLKRVSSGVATSCSGFVLWWSPTEM